MSNGPERQGVLALNCTCTKYSPDKGSTTDRPERLGWHTDKYHVPEAPHEKCTRKGTRYSVTAQPFASTVLLRIRIKGRQIIYVQYLPLPRMILTL